MPRGSRRRARVWLRRRRDAIAPRQILFRIGRPSPCPHPLDRIRNFSIIAHIDHGKSTLADRLIQRTGGLTDREMSAQVLDNMDIEKERGITIKAQTVRLNYTAKDGLDYELNLMDTPGHVDFAYEVSRSLAACEGALLVVDAAQGVEAQTLANVYQSIEHDHEIVPVINKIDLPAAEPEKVKKEIEDIIGISAEDAVLASAKSGIGIDEVLEAIVTRIPPPKGDRDAPLKAMLVDSWYDPYLGVVILVRVVEGVLKKGQQIKFMSDGHAASGRPRRLHAAEDRAADRAGRGRDRLHHRADQGSQPDRASATPSPTPRSRPPRRCRASRRCSRWCSAACSRSMPPISRSCAIRSTSCASTTPRSASRRRSSAALGFGFRCGFLGLLHLEIIQERLTREYDLDLITTAPSVVYKIQLAHGQGRDRAAQPGRHARRRCRSRRSRSRGSRRRSTCPTNISARC